METTNKKQQEGIHMGVELVAINYNDAMEDFRDK